MSVPVAVACAASALLLGLPVLASSAQLDARHSAAAAADAAALAAADAAAGWIEAEPCEIARTVVEAVGVELVSCAADASTAEARVATRVSVPLGTAEIRARAGPATPPL